MFPFIYDQDNMGMSTSLFYVLTGSLLSIFGWDHISFEIALSYKE